MPICNVFMCAYIGLPVDIIKARGRTMSQGTSRGVIGRDLDPLTKRQKQSHQNRGKHPLSIQEQEKDGHPNTLSHTSVTH